MQKNKFWIVLLIWLLAGSTVLQSCLKDTCALTYTIFTPVYKSVQEVRANIKNNAPQQVSQPGKMFVMGRYIFLNEVDKGVHIIDNADPARPVNKYFIDIPGNVDLAVKGNILYADLYSDLVAIDISNPAAVQVKKIVENAFPERRYANGFVADTTQVIVDWQTRDTVVECTNRWVGRPGIMFMDAASFSSSTAKAAIGVGGSMARFALHNEYLYTVSNSSINVFNTADAANPVYLNQVPVGWNVETIYPFKQNLFIGSMSGMFIYGTSNPTQPNRLSMFSHARVCDPVVADDDYAYVTLRSGTTCEGFTNQLDILNIQNLQSPTLVKSYPLTNPHGLTKYNNLLLICDGAAGLKVYDATNVTSLNLLQTIAGIDTYDVIADNNIAMVVGKTGLYQYSINANGQLSFLSKISITQRK